MGQQLVYALQCMLGTDTAVLQDASKWLEQFQQSLEAWTLSDQMLRSNVPDHVHLFCAQTLHSKLQFAWHELVSFYWAPFPL